MNSESEKQTDFPSLFKTAMAFIESIEEPEERINLKIRLVEPVRIFEIKNPSSGLLPDEIDFIESILSEIEILPAGGERDYLYRFVRTEMVHGGFFPTKRMDAILAKIENDEEYQAALFTCGVAAADSAQQKDRALACAERLDDLGSYEKIIRHVLLAESGGEPEPNLVEKIESDEGRFRLWTDCWRRKMAYSADAEQAQRHCLASWNSLDETLPETETLRGRFLSILVRDGEIPLESLCLFLRTNLHPADILEPLGGYAMARKAGFPQQWEAEAGRLADFCVEKIAPSGGWSPESRIRAEWGAAIVFYSANRKTDARSSVRRILETLSEFDSRTEKIAILMRVEKILIEAGEKKGAVRIADRLMTAVQEVESDDLRIHILRDIFLLWFQCGTVETIQKYEAILPFVSRSLLRMALIRAGACQEAENRIESVIEEIRHWEDSFEQATAVLKMCRLETGCTLEL